MGRRAVVGAVVGLVVAAAVVVVGGEPAAAAAPTFTGGQQLTGFGGVTAPSVSTGGNKSLFVYQTPAGTDSAEIFGRITSADTKTVGSPFGIAPNTARRQTKPDVAWNGSNWLVVFEQRWSATDDDIVGQIVSPAGAMVGGAFRIAGSSAREQDPAVSVGANGQWGVTWSTDGNAAASQRDVWFTRISASGASLDGSGQRLSSDEFGPWDDFLPDVAFNGLEYRVVWQGTGAYPIIGGARISAAGAVTCRCNNVGGPVGSHVARPAIAAGGRTFLLVYEWRNTGASNAIDISTSYIDAEGQGGPGIPASSAAGDQTEAAVTWNGSFLVVWRDRRSNPNGALYGARIRSAWANDDPSGFLVTNHYPTNEQPALSTGGATAGTYVIGWQTSPAASSSGILGYGMKFGSK